jgi:hypothetical protein
MMHLITSLRKSSESWRAESMVCCQCLAQAGRLRLNSNLFMVFEGHLCLPDCNCTQMTDQQDA